MTMEDLMKSRHSVRQYEDRPLEEALRAELEREAQQKDEKEGKNAIKIAIAVSAAIIVILF